MEKRYLTTKEAAEYIGGDVSFRTIVRWIHAGKLKAFRNPSIRGHWKILASDLDEMLAGTQESN